MTEFVAAVLPVVSVILGALITHRMNIRAQRRNRIEETLHVAIGAVAEAQAAFSYNYTAHGSDHRRRQEEANDVYNAAVRRARGGLAAASAFAPELTAYLPPEEDDPNVFGTRGQEILTALRQALDANT